MDSLVLKKVIKLLDTVKKVRQYMCNVTILEGHKISSFKDDRDPQYPFLPTGLETSAVYLFESLCGEFTAVMVGDSMWYLDAHKTKVMPI